MDQRQQTLETIIAPTVEALGYDLVRVLVSGRHRPTLQVMAERRDGAAMTAEDCEAISRALSAKLDVEDPIPDSYTLEVSSPGIDRPLVRPRDFARFVGRVARLEARAPIDGRRRFTGRLVAADETRVRLATERGEIELAYADLARARLEIPDDIFKTAPGAAPSH
jgi:ribosome maturation factor RimP